MRHLGRIRHKKEEKGRGDVGGGGRERWGMLQPTPEGEVGATPPSLALGLRTLKGSGRVRVTNVPTVLMVLGTATTPPPLRDGAGRPPSFLFPRHTPSLHADRGPIAPGAPPLKRRWPGWTWLISLFLPGIAREERCGNRVPSDGASGLAQPELAAIPLHFADTKEERVMPISHDAGAHPPFVVQSTGTRE